MDFQYYKNYFSYLEKRLLETQKYVAFEIENIKTFSIEFASIISDCCSIINGFCFELCHAERPDKDKFNVQDYLKYFFGKEELNLSETFVYCGTFIIVPWEQKDLKSLKAPVWWVNYNDMKHSGKASFKKATLRNAISCLAGLYVLLSAYDYLTTKDEPESYFLGVSDFFVLATCKRTKSWDCMKK